MSEALHNTTPSPAPPVDEQDPALAATVERFERISRDLRSSYAELAARAEHVERELVRTNAELERRVAELDAVLEALPTGVLVRDADGRVTRGHGAAAALLQRDADQLVGQVRLDGLPADPQAEERVELTRADGSARTLFTRAGAIRDGRGSVQLLDDRTQVERLARRASDAEKLAAIGTLGAGIAHEIRNPLNATKGFCALLARDAALEAKHVRWAELAVAGCEEAEGIISGLLHVADPGALELSTIQLTELVDDVLERCPEAAESRIDVELEATQLCADAIKLRQALRNLVQNALEHQDRPAHVRVCATTDGDELTLRVTDAGPGLDPAVAERVLEPFFTTRAEGTGLGLALCHTIARLHGGRLEVSPRSADLGGAEFRLCLPLVAADRPPTAEPLAVR